MTKDDFARSLNLSVALQAETMFTQQSSESFALIAAVTFKMLSELIKGAIPNGVKNFGLDLLTPKGA
jgi:hypothetical protein